MAYRKMLAMMMGALLVVLAAGTAWADNVVNDVDASDDTVTIVAGSVATVDFKIVATNANNEHDRQRGCNASDGSPATVTFRADPAVTTPLALVFDECGEFKPARFTSSVPGRYAISVDVTDAGIGEYHEVPAGFTLVVDAAPEVVRPPVDTTPPEVTYSVSGTEGRDGWYTGDVELAWSVSEPESPVSVVLTGCEDQAITTDQFATSYSCVASSTGGTSETVSVSIKRDATAPVSSVTGIDADVYYTGSPLPVVGCGDEEQTSGLASSSTSTLERQVNANGVGRDVWSCSGAVDVAGNRATAAVRGYGVAYGGISELLEPISSASTTRVSRGKSFPVKFRVAGDEPAGFAVNGWSVERRLVGCTAGSASFGAPVAVGTNSVGLRYDPSADHYIYNADLRDAPVGSCWQLRGRFDNGQTTPWSGVLSLTK